MATRIHVVTNKYHFDRGIKISLKPANEAVLLTKHPEQTDAEELWVPKILCNWDVMPKTGDVQLHVEEWFYNKNTEFFEEL